jgi:hypothetical protein
MNSSEDNPAPIEPPGRGRLVPAAEPPADNQDELTGLPGLRSWRHVYLFVFACFVLWVLLLLALTVLYS